MKLSIRSVLITVFATTICGGTLTSCFTGIENTKKIELSRQDKKQLESSPEDSFLKDLEGLPLADWTPGDQFLVADSRIALLLESNYHLSSSDPTLVGRHLSYKGSDIRLRPDRTTERIILFTDSVSTYRYPTGMTPEKADTTIISTRLPMAIDLKTLAKVRERMAGKDIWTKSSLWYTPDGEKADGRKYSAIRIDEILPGSALFPIKVLFTDDRGETRMVWMNYSSAISDSRRFPVLFSLTDKRKDYPHIPDEHWRLIQNGELALGMTKEECKLSLGNPSDAMAGHTHSQTLDIWQYPDGTFLRFADGLLVDFRR